MNITLLVFIIAKDTLRCGTHWVWDCTGASDSEPRLSEASGRSHWRVQSSASGCLRLTLYYKTVRMRLVERWVTGQSYKFDIYETVIVSVNACERVEIREVARGRGDEDQIRGGAQEPRAPAAARAPAHCHVQLLCRRHSWITDAADDVRDADGPHGPLCARLDPVTRWLPHYEREPVPHTGRRAHANGSGRSAATTRGRDAAHSRDAGSRGGFGQRYTSRCCFFCISELAINSNNCLHAWVHCRPNGVYYVISTPHMLPYSNLSQLIQNYLDHIRLLYFTIFLI